MDNPIKIFTVFVFIIITQYLLRNKFSLAERKRQVWAIDLKSYPHPPGRVTCDPDQEHHATFYKLTTVTFRDFFGGRGVKFCIHKAVMIGTLGSSFVPT